MKYEVHVAVCSYRLRDVKSGSAVVLTDNAKNIDENSIVYLVTNHEHEKARTLVSINTGQVEMISGEEYVIPLKQTHKSGFTTEMLIPSGSMR